MGKGGRCVGPTTFPHSCDECLKIWELEPHSPPSTCTRLYRDCFAFIASVSNDRRDDSVMVRKETVVA